MIVTEDCSAGAVEEVDGFVVDTGDYPPIKGSSLKPCPMPERSPTQVSRLTDAG
jgi:hypothetical protein